ncbi:MAG: cell division protein FtsA [Chitinophagales bacterium]|nr:cell division protein FtsA [Chitinophagales bacterium]
MEHHDIIVGLDIGTTKICAIVGRMTAHGKVEVLGMGKADSLGVMRGVVANIDKTVQAISQAVEEAQLNSKQQIGKVFVGIAGQHIKSLQHRGILTRERYDEEIGRGDVQKLISDMYRLVLPPGDRIIHVLPQEFIIDNEQGIKDPIGMSGIRLEANFHIISGQITAAQNINKCVEKAGLTVADLILEPLASSASVLSEEEKEAGVALVDIGGGTTDIAIFQDGIIRHTAVIPFGGNIITEDIKEGCLIMRNQAEQLKIRFGSAFAIETQENEIVSIPGLRGREPKEISIRNLAHIIQARMEEILEQVYFEIKSSGFEKKLIGGIVLTGGGSQLKHLVQLVEYVTGMDARVGYPTEHLAKSPVAEIKNPMYATGIGLIIKGYEELKNAGQLASQQQKKKAVVEAVAEDTMVAEPEVEMHTEPQEQRPRWWESLFKKGREWLEEDAEDFK